jgi:hypothetical protein
MADMNPFTFALMLLAQRADEALRLERLRAQPDPLRLVGLQRRKHRLRLRLRRALVSRPLAAS